MGYRKERIKQIKRNHDNDNIRVALYINEEDDMYCDLQIEYEDQCINISSYEIEKNSMEFWEFYEVTRKKMEKEANKLENESWGIIRYHHKIDENSLSGQGQSVKMVHK